MHTKIILLLLSCVFAAPICASDFHEIYIEIKENKFIPSQVHAPANVKIKIVVENKDDSVEEFESSDLNREKIIPPGKKVNIVLPPLKEGRYEFMGEFHPETTKGFLIIE